MSKWDGLNRRRFPRVNFPCLIVLHGKDAESHETILCHTDNIGIGGVCINLKQHAKLFSEVDLEIDLMDMKEHIRCKGKVVWNVRHKKDLEEKAPFYDIGIEYIDLKPEDQKRIESIINKLVRDKKDKSYVI